MSVWKRLTSLGELRHLFNLRVLNAARRGHLATLISINQGTTSPGEVAFIQELVTEANALPGPIVEIGTLFGFTTNELALAKSPDKPLITVDNFSWNPWGLTRAEHRNLADRVLRFVIATRSVKIVVSGKNEFYQSYGGASPSMVFLDAIHSYEETKRDIEWAISCGTRLISGHDFSNAFPGVQKAVREFGKPDLRESVWVLRR